MKSAAAFRLVFLDAATYGDIPLDSFAAAWACAVHPHSSPSQVRSRLAGHQGAVVNKVRLDQATLFSDEAKSLRLIVVAATGTDNVDLQAARSRGIAVCNVPGYATRSVAQHALALILELATGVGRSFERVRGGAWEKSPVFTLLDYPSVELAGKTLGIIGFGNIGREVGTMARGLGMSVLVAARSGARAPLPEGRTPFEEVLRRSDVITLHCPLNAETRHLVNGKTLSFAKPGAFLVNTARGGLVDDEALIEALASGHLGGAALDVLSEEPPPPGHPLIEAARRLDNLIITPHSAWSARESRQRLLDAVAENIRAYLRGEKKNRVA